MIRASEPGRGALRRIPVIPFTPVPRNMFRIIVSALSLALCATATAANPLSLHTSANQPYLSSLAAISTLIPLEAAYPKVSKSFFMNIIPWLSAHSLTSASSESLSSPLKWKLQ